VQAVAGVVRRDAPFPTGSVARLLALLCGAALGAVLTIEAPRAAPAAPLGFLVIVVVAATAAFHGLSDVGDDDRSHAG
jgi:hypothetical protein